MEKQYIWIITLFPQFFEAFSALGVNGQLLKGDRGEASIELKCIDLRPFGDGKHQNVDDSPYGGGPGMVMRADVLKRCLEEAILRPNNLMRDDLHIIFPSPRGSCWKQQLCRKWTHKHLLGENKKHLVFICGRYEGVDERFLARYVDEELSIGDYILTGGEVATLAFLDSALRLLPGALHNDESSLKESFEQDLLEHPQYTKPREFEGEGIPDVLLSGHHKKIEEYQRAESLRITRSFRPDLLKKEEK